ncbi:hypothetical protein [Kordia periserrulae]|uniref:hypothetical protein n=1 Tax=Kordia periserrulae TaxID=701523 RepID=UPI0011B24117|nr:hypothetical protein [Kordia periserrulae]
MKVSAQGFPLPKLASPEDTFYTYLDNEHISNPEKFNGNVKKVVRTLRKYEQGVDPSTVDIVTTFLNRNKKRTKTVSRYYVYGIEEYKEEVNHLETPEATITKEGNKTIKTIKDDGAFAEYEYTEKGDDIYVYENDLLLTFYNHNDSLAYAYDDKNQLTFIHTFESLLLDEVDENGEIAARWRSVFEVRGLEVLEYQNELPKQKVIYDKFGEVIDIYKKTYDYNSDKLLTKFTTEYKRYLYDDYVDSIAIDQQKYEEFPRVETNDSIQVGTFQYSKTNKITGYQRTKGKENEVYKIIYNNDDLMYLVEGTLTFYQKGKLVSLDVEYEYLYDEKGNPKSIKTFYYLGGEKMIDKETFFEIVYYE